MINRITSSLVILTAFGAMVASGCGGASEEFDAPDFEGPEFEALEFEQIDSDLSSNCAPTVDPLIQVPAGNKLGFELDAVGYQVYVCQSSTTGYAWALQAPDAKLYNSKGKEVGIHYVGPTWEYKDGSKVVGARVAGVTPDTTAIPWLLIQATAHEGSGKLAGVTYIQRLATVGGLAPAAATCTADNVGALAPIEYTAEYYYFVSGKPPCGCK
jgi:hypothetical protein